MGRHQLNVYGGARGAPSGGWKARSPEALVPYIASRRDALAKDLESSPAEEHGLEASGYNEKLPTSVEDSTSQTRRRVTPSNPKPKIRRVTSKKSSQANTEGDGSETTEHSITKKHESR